MNISTQFRRKLLLASLLLSAGMAAQAQTPFACTDNASYVITGTPSELRSINLRTGAQTSLRTAADLGNHNLTALGYNATDNFLYASINGTNDLVKIGSNGAVTLIDVPGLPADTYEAGDVSPDGTMYLYSSSSTTMYKVNLSTLAVSTITVQPGNVPDISISPDGNYIYGLSANNGNLAKWPISGGSVTATDVTAAGPVLDPMATFMDNTGDLYLLSPANTVYEIPGAASAVNRSLTLIATQGGATLTNTDGARCVNSNATTNTPLGCIPNQVYITSGTRGYDPTSCISAEGHATLTTYNLTTNTYTTSGQLINDFNSSTSINSLGYNPTDNYLWGHRFATNQLVRIGANNTVDYFAIPGLPSNCPVNTGPQNTFFGAGDISADGILYLLNGIGGTHLYRVDLNPASPTYLTMLPPLSLGSNTPYSGAVSSIADLAFNPINNQLYTLTTNGTLYQINTQTGALSIITTISGIAGTGNFVAQFFDNSGNLYVQRGNSNALYKIANVASITSPTAATLDNGNALSIAGGGDGARCAFSAIAPALLLTGTIYNDGNGLNDSLINGTPSNFGGTVFANLVDPVTNKVITSVAVGPDGTYSIPVTANTNYQVILTTTAQTPGTTLTTATPPSGYSFIGEGISAAGDGTPNGIVSVSVGTTNLNDVYFGLNNQPLPVTLIAFSVRSEGNAAQLAWSTATEINNTGFAIQRSVDLRSWSTIGFVNTKDGHSNIRQEYGFTDATPRTGMNYYRLRQIDTDGQSSESPVRSVVIEKGMKGLQAYPNPVKDQLTVNGLIGNERIQILDLTGRIVTDLTNTSSADTQVLNIRTLSEGSYILNIRSEDGTMISKKLIKTK